MVSIRKAKQGFQLRRKNQRDYGQIDKEKIGLIAAGLCIGFLVIFLYSVILTADPSEPRGVPESLRQTKQHPKLMEERYVNDGGSSDSNGDGSDNESHPRITHRPKIVPMGDIFNSVALDIVDTLDCKKLLEEATKKIKSRSFNINDYSSNEEMEEDIGRRRRRLNEMAQQHGDDGGISGMNNMVDVSGKQKEQEDAEVDDSIPEEKRVNNELDDDTTTPYDDLQGGGFGYNVITAKHLFCIAASESPPESLTNEIRCDAANKKRRTLLDLWSAARSQMEPSLFLKVLDLATEQNQYLLGVSYNIWAPIDDEGVQFMVNTLNSEKDVDNGGINGLEDALGPGKIFVDVGSCLGLTCLAVNSKYPGTKIISVEPAAPSWLLQELNLRCNLPREEFKNIHVVLAGVGTNTDDEDNMMAKLMWRPTSTTSTRSWTPSEEFKSDDVELIVRLRRLKSILAEANVIQTPIDVMNLDCQGCEYNLIPALSEEEYEAIPTVMGGVHWGYIKPNKLPSSARGKTTHKRLCLHENIAKNTKECCAFPDLPVKSSVPGEILQKDSKGFPPTESTVSDVISENLCDNFSSWAEEHYLNDVEDDFNWFELSSQA